MTRLKSALTALSFTAVSALSAAPAFAEDIVDIAVGAGTFNTLITAAAAAGLADDLKGPGPFTVYAPTDEAFAALPEGTVESLLQPENRDQLIAVLLTHVDDRVVTSSMLPHATIPIRPMGDSKLCVTRVAKGLEIRDAEGRTAKTVATDVQADNGVIHIIDMVLLPGEQRCGH